MDDAGLGSKTHAQRRAAGERSGEVVVRAAAVRSHRAPEAVHCCMARIADGA